MKKAKKIIALLLTLLMVFTMVSSSFITVAEPAITNFEEVTNVTDTTSEFIKSIIYGVHSLVGGILSIFNRECPFCSKVHEKSNDNSEVPSPTNPEENTSYTSGTSEGKPSIRDNIDNTIDAGFGLFDSIHNLVGGILAIFNKTCPFCSKIHGKSNSKYYTVTFNLNYEGAPEFLKQKVEQGNCVIMPEAPTREGYYFVDWFLDMNYTKVYNSADNVNADLTLYAKWDQESQADIYYKNNSELLDVIDAKSSDETMTESEAVTFLKDRGFADYPVTYEYSIDGEYSDKLEASGDSVSKHPMYQTIYLSSSGEAWIIYIINGMIFANPFYFNAESDLDVQLIISESEKFTSYDDETNKFYITIPHKSEILTKTVDSIDANTLDNLTMEDIENYEN